MDFLGVGPLELVFIFLIALIVLGPNDMIKTGRTLGRFLRRVVTSDAWRSVQQATREVRYLPNKLMRESGIEDMEELKDIQKEVDNLRNIRKDMSIKLDDKPAVEQSSKETGEQPGERPSWAPMAIPPAGTPTEQEGQADLSDWLQPPKSPPASSTDQPDAGDESTPENSIAPDRTPPTE